MSGLYDETLARGRVINAKATASARHVEVQRRIVAWNGLPQWSKRELVREGLTLIRRIRNLDELERVL